MRYITIVIITAAGLLSSAAHAQQSATVASRNVLSVSPLQMSEFTPTGVGAQLEHFIGLSGKWSLYLPIAYTFGKSDPCDASVRTHMLYAYPGIKFYPFGSSHTVTYAVGPSVAAGRGNTNCACVNGGETGTDVNVAKEYKPITELGMLINNSINIHASERIYMGAEIGVGSSVLDIENGKNLGADLMLQMNIKVGYRF